MSTPAERDNEVWLAQRWPEMARRGWVKIVGHPVGEHFSPRKFVDPRLPKMGHPTKSDGDEDHREISKMFNYLAR